MSFKFLVPVTFVQKALTLGLAGRVRNLPDGRVEALNHKAIVAVVEAMSYWFWKAVTLASLNVEAVETEIHLVAAIF